MPSCITLSFVLATIAFTILQVRLEIFNYKFGEGFVTQLMKWWKNTHQDEISENEEFGVNFQRLMTVMIAVCFVFFFASGNIILGDQEFLGYRGKVPMNQLIQIVVIDLLWAMIVIQNPDSRRKFIHLITCKSETIQIVRM